MKCLNCGKPLPEGNIFCPNCGAAVSGGDSGSASGFAGAPAPSSARSDRAHMSPAAASRPAPDRGYAGDAGVSAGVRILRELSGSAKYLVAVITYTASIIFGLIAASTIASSMIYQFFGILDQLGMSDMEISQLEQELADYALQLDGFSFMFGLVANIPAILTALGLWMIFFAGKNRKDRSFSTSGLTIIQVINIIAFVLDCIISALTVILTISMYASLMGYLDDSGDAAAPMLIGLVVTVLIIVLPLLYLFKIIKMVGGAKQMAITGRPVQTGSVYVGVIVMLSVLPSIFSLILSPMMGKLQVLCSSIAAVCFSMLIFSFRTKISEAIAFPETASDAGSGSGPSYNDYQPSAGPALSPYSDDVNPGMAPYGGMPASDPAPAPYGGAPASGPASAPYGRAPVSREASAASPFGGAPASGPASAPYGGAPVSREASAASPFGGAPASGPASAPYGGASLSRGASAASPFGGAPASGPASAPYGGAPASRGASAASPYGGVPASGPASAPYIDIPVSRGGSADPVYSDAPISELTSSDYGSGFPADHRAAAPADSPAGSLFEKADSGNMAMDYSAQGPSSRLKGSLLSAGSSGKEDVPAPSRLKGSLLSSAPEEASSASPAPADFPSSSAGLPAGSGSAIQKDAAPQKVSNAVPAHNSGRSTPDSLLSGREPAARPLPDRLEADIRTDNPDNPATVYASPYETTFTNESTMRQPTAYLLRTRNNTKVSVNVPLLRMGRSSSLSDYVIEDNPAIGRHHADIVWHDGKYSIIDKSSVNHVYINGQIIPPEKEVPLADNAEIRLADETFLFKAER